MSFIDIDIEAGKIIARLDGECRDMAFIFLCYNLKNFMGLIYVTIKNSKRKK